MGIDWRVGADFQPPPSLATIRAGRQQTAIQQQEMAVRAQEMQVRGQEMTARDRALRDSEQVQAILRQSGGDVDKALPQILAVSPELGLKFQAQLTEGRKAKLDFQSAKIAHDKAQLELIGQTLQGATDQESWLFGKHKLQAAGIDTSDMQDEFDPKRRDFLIAQGQTIQQRVEAENKRIDNERAAQMAATAAANTAADNKRADAQLGLSADANARLAQGASETARHNRAMEQRPVSGGTTSEARQNVVDAVQGMIDGITPPILPGRASKDYIALIAEAKRRGYDLAVAATDWAATQKHIATANNSQQTRLHQSINALPELLDSVDALASKWKGGRFPILNRANLALAKGGAYGADVATVANQLDAQIADVTADLGNVYMGGNSPTDQALGLAAKALNAEWNEKVLHDMVTLARKNVQIRRNSINNTGVQGASANNPYAIQPPAAAAGPTEGATKPIPGYPGTEQTYTNGKWIRTK